MEKLVNEESTDERFNDLNPIALKDSSLQFLEVIIFWGLLWCYNIVMLSLGRKNFEKTKKFKEGR